MANKNFKKTSKFSTGAKVTLKIMTLREFLKYYKNLKKSGYQAPPYQRETSLKNASSMMVSLLSYALQYEKGHAPLIDFIYIREVQTADGKLKIEIIDGQHRSEIFSFIVNDEAVVANKDVNKELNKICQEFGGKHFSELDTDIQETILNLQIPIQFVTCSDEIANTLFQILNSGKPLNTNDKVRNNWYKNNMYCEVESVIKSPEVKEFGMRADAIRNMIYRCLALHKDIRIPVIGSASTLNDKILEKTEGAKWTPEKCASVVEGIVEILTVSNTIMSGRNQHEKMGMYLFFNSLSNKKAVMKKLSMNKHKNAFLTSYIKTKINAEKTGSTFHTDTAHNINYSKGYMQIINVAYSSIWKEVQNV